MDAGHVVLARQHTPELPDAGHQPQPLSTQAWQVFSSGTLQDKIGESGDAS